MNKIGKVYIFLTCLALLLLISGCIDQNYVETNSDIIQTTSETELKETEYITESETESKPLDSSGQEENIIESGSVESEIATGPLFSYNVSGVSLGACTNCVKSFNDYSKGNFIPGATVRIWGEIQNRNNAENAEILVRIYIRYWSSEEPNGKYAVDTDSFKIKSETAHDFDFTANIPEDAHQVKISVGTTAAWSSSVTANFSATLKPEQ